MENNQSQTDKLIGAILVGVAAFASHYYGTDLKSAPLEAPKEEKTAPKKRGRKKKPAAPESMPETQTTEEAEKDIDGELEMESEKEPEPEEAEPVVKRCGPEKIGEVLVAAINAAHESKRDELKKRISTLKTLTTKKPKKLKDMTLVEKTELTNRCYEDALVSKYL